MIKKHDGMEERAHTFDQVWERLNASDAQQLTTRAGTPFVATAAIATRGKRRDEPVIRYFQDGQEYGRCYKCCWEHYYNCNRTRIGMYSKAVDEWTGSTGGVRKLTRQDLLKLIEHNGGPQGLDLSGMDLSGLKLGGDAIRAEMKASGVSVSQAVPSWVYVIGGEPVGINLSGANLSNANLVQASLQGANLSFADLRDASMVFADMEDARLFRVEAQGAWMGSTKLRRANIEYASLQGIHLDYADLRDTSLGWASLTGAWLYDANLEGASLSRANLQGAYLVQSNLSHVRLNGASLREVDLTGTESLAGVYFFGTRLERTNLKSQQLSAGIGEEIDGDYDKAKEAYLALKTNFESIGRYDDASWAYTKERKMKKVMNHPRHARRYYAEEEKLPYNVNWRSARLWGFYLRHTSECMMDWVVELVCGYGESFRRVLATLVLVYVLFTLGYGVTWSVMRVTSGPEGLTRTFSASPVDWAIFSLGALTTMDPAGLEPRDNLVQLASGLEALLGIFLTGLLGFVVANRIRRS